MNKKIKLTEEQIDIISDFNTLTKRIAIEMFLAGKSSSEVFLLESINEEETKIKNQWFSQMLKDMKSQRYDGRIADLFEELKKNQNNKLSLSKSEQLREISDRTVNVDKILSKFEKYASRNNGHQCDNFYFYLNLYKERILRFDEVAYTELTQKNSSIKEIVEHFRQEETMLDISLENMLYITQTIKHINFYKSRGIPATIELLRTALDARYCYDAKILEEQAKLVISTYGSYKNTFQAEKIKDLCYEFIYNSFQVAHRAHPLLISFLFLGKWISPKTFDLLRESYDIITKFGMKHMILSELRKFTSTITDDTELSDTHKYALTLERIYNK